MALYSTIYQYRFSDGTSLVEDASKINVGTPKIYKPITGESLLDISYKFYGNHTDWHIIASANSIIDPYEDVTGVSLIIPQNGRTK